MLTRTAIYEGRVREGHEEEFHRRVQDELYPFWARFPGATAIRVQRTHARDEGAAAVVMILEMDFPDQETLNACLASPIRSESRAATLEVMKLFDGRYYHVVSLSTSLVPGSG